MRHFNNLVAAASAALILATPTVSAAKDSDAMIAAAAQLSAKIDATSPSGQPPLLTNSDGQSLRTVFNPANLRAMPLDDLGSIGQACGAIGSVLTAYTHLLDRADTTAGGADALFVRIQDEVSLGAVASAVCTQRAFRAAERLVSTVPPERWPGLRPGLKQMRDGASMVVDGSLAQVSIAGVKPSNVSMILSALLEDPQAMAASYPADERQALRTKILDHAGKVPASSRSKVEALAASFAAPQCNILCKIAGSE